MKKKTKTQREKEQKAALHQRIGDIVAGACGEDRDVDGNDYISVSELGNIIEALESRLELPKRADEDQRSWMFEPWHLEHFDCIENIIDFLWEHGVRA